MFPLSISVPVALALLHFTSALPHSPRATAYEDSNGYAPTSVACPANFGVRTPGVAGPLNTAEAQYVAQKTKKNMQAWEQYISNVGLTGFNTQKFFAPAHKQYNKHKRDVNEKRWDHEKHEKKDKKHKKDCKKSTTTTSSKHCTKTSSTAPTSTATKSPGRTPPSLPNFAIAASGGGLRALLNGGAVLNGFDSRNPAAVQAKTGGILQLANYLGGLSGGGWLVSSIAVNDFAQTPALNQTVWHLDSALLTPPPYAPTANTEIVQSIAAKKAAGFPVSFVDYYGRALSYHFVNDTQYGRSTLFDGITTTSSYQNHQIPFPLLVGTTLSPGDPEPEFGGVIYEFNPLEFGTFDPSVNAFVPMQYMGSSAVNGRATQCVKGFDNAGFIFGISSDIFDASTVTNALAQNIIQSVPGLEAVFADVPADDVTAGLVPSSFKGLAPTAYADSSEATLRLLDGGLADENVPFWPFQQPARQIDAVIAIDSSADTPDHYPNGTAPYTTYLKSQLSQYKEYPFPAIPQAYPVDTFLDEGYNRKPSFFGCNETASPLIVYLPNYNQTFNGTGTSTFQQTYTGTEIDGFFDNGFNIATQQKGSTVDSEWPACLTCALIDRQVSRSGMARTPQCSGCFARYCA